MNISLEELRNLSDKLYAIPDDRPDWLKAMPYALESVFHYYRLLWELVKQKKPEYTLEIGIDKAGSTMTLAAAHPTGIVISVDIDQAACENARKIALAHGLLNLRVVQNDSIKHVEFLSGIGRKADLLFLDGYHDFSHAYAEYLAYRPLMKPGGIILFDDIHESKQMDSFWQAVRDPKVECPKSHWTGFGACKVDHSVICPTVVNTF